MSGSDPLVLPFADVTSIICQRFECSSKWIKMKLKHVYRNTLDLLNTNLVLFFLCVTNRFLSSCHFVLFLKNVSKYKNEHIYLKALYILSTDPALILCWTNHSWSIRHFLNFLNFFYQN